MKFLKIFAIALAAFSVTACSDDETPINSESGVTVEMGRATYSTKEGRDMIKVPLTVTGERNGNVTVTLAIKSDYSNPAIDEKNVYLTTKTIVIFPEDNTYNVELTIVDDKEMNEARWCDVTIVSAEGATVGSQNFTQVEIKDNDSEPYDRCAGNWVLKTASINDAGQVVEGSLYIKLNAYDEGHNGYNNYYGVTGLVSGTELNYRAYFHYDKEAGEGYIEFELGQSGGLMEINATFGDQQIILMQLVEENGQLYIVNQGSTLFNINSDFTEMTAENLVEPDLLPHWGFLFNAGGWYILDEYYVSGMARPADY